MPLDGITLNSVVQEIASGLLGGRIDKIQQPEPDEIIMAIRCRGQNHKLLLTANASSPRLHLTGILKPSPAQAPMFCMLLRKHLGAGRIIGIIQPDLERIVEIFIESPNEMGDLSTKRLVMEIMGKHSNIMLLDKNGTIMDSIRHVSREMSSVREIYPGRQYTRPPSQGKLPPVPVDKEYFMSLFSKNEKIQKIIYQSYNGISPVMASEICLRADVPPDNFPEVISDETRLRLLDVFMALYSDVQEGKFVCRIYDNEKRDFSAIPLTVYQATSKPFKSPSEMLETFYSEQDNIYRLKQKTGDLRKLTQNHLERCLRKQQVHKATVKETEDRDRLRHYGELLTAYIYAIPTKADRVTLKDFYSESEAEIDIPLDPTLTPAENAQKYFKRYNKSKRAFAAVQLQMTENAGNIAYLESVLAAIDSVEDEQDIDEIRMELAEQGFIKKSQRKNKKSNKKSKPLRYRSSEGFDIYVGKNNTQNDELTLKFARSGDIWLHTKEIAGTHVIIQKGGKEIPESTILEGAMIAAYHSKGRQSSQVPVDYCPRKNVRKPKGAKPGFVIYDFYNTIYVTPKEDEVKGLLVLV